MRTRNDLKILRFSLICGVTLDMERVANDPAWVMASRHFDTEDPLQMDAALVEYLKHYLAKEVMLTEMPSTNGPADVYGLECTGPRLAEQQATEAREKLRAELLAAEDAPVPAMTGPTAQQLYDRLVRGSGRRPARSRDVGPSGLRDVLAGRGRRSAAQI